jgi:hypothetical protein
MNYVKLSERVGVWCLLYRDIWKFGTNSEPLVTTYQTVRYHDAEDHNLNLQFFFTAPMKACTKLRNLSRVRKFPCLSLS